MSEEFFCSSVYSSSQLASIIGFAQRLQKEKTDLAGGSSND